MWFFQKSFLSTFAFYQNFYETLLKFRLGLKWGLYNMNFGWNMLEHFLFDYSEFHWFHAFGPNRPVDWTELTRSRIVEILIWDFNMMLRNLGAKARQAKWPIEGASELASIWKPTLLISLNSDSTTDGRFFCEWMWAMSYFNFKCFKNRTRASCDLRRFLKRSWFVIDR